MAKVKENLEVKYGSNSLNKDAVKEFLEPLEKSIHNTSLSIKGKYKGSANQITVTGIYFFLSSEVTALPVGWSDGFILHFNLDEVHKFQIILSHNGERMIVRSLWGSNWGPFITIK